MTKLPSLPKIKQVNRCECGCNGLTGNRFVPGHDSRLNGMIKRVIARVWDAREGASQADQFEALAAAMSPGQAIATAKAMGVNWTPKTQAKAS